MLTVREIGCTYPLKIKFKPHVTYSFKEVCAKKIVRDKLLQNYFLVRVFKLPLNKILAL